MITKVSLKNWRSHLQSEMSFTEGTNCFIGSMGSGKSSVMDAVCFGLFGTFPQLQQRKIKLEDIIMKKPRRQEEAEVTVLFDINGTEWSVKRTVRKGKSTAELKKNNEVIESPQPSKVTSEIEKVLKIDYDLFTRAIYSEQNQLDMFLTIPKGQRMKKIDQLLAIDKFENARLTTKSLVNKCTSVSTERDQFVKTLEADESLFKMDALRNELDNLVKEKKMIKEEFGKAAMERQRIITRIEKLKEMQKRLQEIKEEIKTYSALLDIIDKDIEKLKEDLMDTAEKTMEDFKIESTRTKVEIQTTESSLKKERGNLEILKHTFTEKEARLNHLEKEMIPEIKRQVEERNILYKRLKSKDIKKLKSDLNKNLKETDKSKLRLQRSTAKIMEIEESLKDLKKAGSLCPVCDRELTRNKKLSIISNKQKQIKLLRKESRSLKPKIKRLEREVSVLEVKLKDAEVLKQRFDETKDRTKELDSLTKELKELRTNLSSYLNEKKMLEKTMELLEINLLELKERENKITQASMKRNEVDEKMKRLKEYSKKISELHIEKGRFSDFSQETLESFERKLQSIIALEKEYEVKVDNISTIISEKQKRIEEIETKRKVIEDYKKEVRKIQAISDQLKLLEISFLSTQEQLRKDFVLAVNQAMQSIWEDLYPYKDIYGVKLGIEEGDYVLQLQDRTGWVPADGVASGGERTIACLALRIAFALVLAPQLRWLVLDEPTHNLDAKAVEDLATVLREKVSDFVDQIFLITHDNSLETAVSGYLYRLERNKEKDEPTRVAYVSGFKDF